MTRREFRRLVATSGWHVKYDRRAIRRPPLQFRLLTIEAQFDYEASCTRRLERRCEKHVLNCLGLDRHNVDQAEWTNDDGGPKNLLTIIVGLWVSS